MDSERPFFPSIIEMADRSGPRPSPLEVCAMVGCPNTRHKMSEFCDAHARAQPAYELDGPAKARAEHERIMAQLKDWAKRNTLSWASKPESRDLYNMLCDALAALKELGNG